MRTSFSDSNFVLWYGDGSAWPSSNMSSVKWPSYVPATAIEEACWKIPARRSLARSIACFVPPTLSSAFCVASAAMS